MRYCLLSDIHGNLEALQAVLGALSKEAIDKYLCVGDVVGYGADPKACIRVVKSLNPQALIAGNHEWGVLGLTGIDYFNKMAREAVIWTRGVLDQDELGYLKSFQLVYEERVFTLVHGTLDSPEAFNYILNAASASSTINMMKTALCFVGHSHRPGIFCSGKYIVESSKGFNIKIDPRNRYVVNVGSIGQPRDYDPRASYAIYDDETGSIEIKRVEYDIKAAQEKILKAGLPAELAYRLAEGR